MNRITQRLNGLALMMSAAAAFAADTTASKYNVLFIAVDDLRPQMGCYGNPQMKSPNMDRLASSGVLFTRAYCQQAVCAPTRASLLTGLRPDTTGVHDLVTHIRLKNPDVVTLPQYFKQHGYQAISLSKVFHHGLDDPESWSEPSWFPNCPMYTSMTTRLKLKEEADRRKAAGKLQHRAVTTTDPKTGVVLQYKDMNPQLRGPSWEMAEGPDNRLDDGATADKAVEVLGRIKDKPFFLAVGFLRPHLPFVAPKKYYDLYPSDKIELPPNMFFPDGAPRYASNNHGEVLSYSDVGTTVTPQKARELIRGYYASVSYVDAQIGRVIDELDRLGLREKTIVILWGDHGWQLGEHDMWTKHTNFEEATRVPLIISVPGQKRAGAKSKALVEFVDVYPTLVELCGMEMPTGLQGKSFVPLLEDPDRAWKEAAFSQFPRDKKKVMGYTMRTDRYRYTEWLPFDKDKGRAESGVLAVELYDYRTDPRGDVNIAMRAENAELTATLSKMLREGRQQVR